jgi:membrane-associated protein
VSTLLDGILNLGPGLIYLTVALLVFAEDALFVGFVLPGETAAVLGGVAASQGHVEVGAMAALVVLAAVLGDTVGYEVGRRFGPRLLETRTLRRHGSRIDDAREFLLRRGGWAVFLGRFIAFFRAVMPALAGLSGLRYRTFLPFNAAGGLVWGVGCVLLGYLAGASYAAIESRVGRDVAIAVVVIAGVVLVVVPWWRRRHRTPRERG